MFFTLFTLDILIFVAVGREIAAYFEVWLFYIICAFVTSTISAVCMDRGNDVQAT